MRLLGQIGIREKDERYAILGKFYQLRTTFQSEKGTLWTVVKCYLGGALLFMKCGSAEA